DWRICEDRIVRIATAAAGLGGHACLDMEWSHTIDGTLALYRRLRERGLANVSVVSQARLHRAQRDLAVLAALAPHVRICKGIYPEPAQIAYTDPEAIRRNFAFCLATLLDARGYAAIATHDEALLVSALSLLTERKRNPGTYEFQMLLG